MRTTTLLSVTALASTALAQPFAFGHNHHARHHHARRGAAVEKRDIVTDWTTEWVTETVTEYIDMTETLVINTATTPGQFFEGSSTPPAAAAPQPTSSSQAAPVPQPPAPTPKVPAPSPPPVQQQAPSPAPVAPKVQQAPEPSPEVPQAPETTRAPAPPSIPSPAPVAPSPPSGGSSSSGGGSSSAMSFGGEVTHYTVGLGACGFDDAGKDNSDYIVAISKDLMHGSNGDPMCGKKVNLSYNGKSITATIRDKCPSCSSSQIDLSEKAFKDLVGDLGIGRQSGVKWTVA